MKVVFEKEDFELNIQTATFRPSVKKVRLTRRVLFYHGIRGRLRCFYFWLRFTEEKRKISFGKWLDEPVAYSIEPSFDFYHDSKSFRNQVEKEFEHYLTDEVPKM
jgi:hypothetical protein